ncbi:signal peptidase II [Candidatus Uhrbacteria bacterium]|nr:signal peptidase II [Candidatus Uhrbacteria bacterium]
MKPRFFIYFILIPSALIVFFDELIKSVAIKNFPEESYLASPKFLEFAIHKNYGLAFDIPFRLEFVIIISVILGIFLLRIVLKNIFLKPRIAFSVILILLGASGNFYDRIVYGFTVDYIILFGKSAINFSDLIIILGVLSLLLLSSKKHLTNNETVIE